MDDAPPPPIRILEALLFVGGEPLTLTRIGEIIRGLDPAMAEQKIAELKRLYESQNRPYAIRETPAGYVLELRPRYQGLHDRLQGGTREARLSTAAIDVLAVVAYRQPITKAEVDALRGAESGSLLRQLTRRGLVQVTESAYRTTARFLDFMGITSPEDLPRTLE